VSVLTAEGIAQRFHEAYERLAPQFGYATRAESAVPWPEVPENNRRLMTAVCGEILPHIEAAVRADERVRVYAALATAIEAAPPDHRAQIVAGIGGALSDIAKAIKMIAALQRSDIKEAPDAA
jgi:hypothetical protein